VAAKKPAQLLLSQKITGMEIERPTNEAYVAGKTAAMYEVCPDVK
jgi:hypothetical protein